MKINKLKINSFGKLKDKELEFKNGINLVYGENESGKSTVLKFILGMFYGISKNKNGKNISDFDKYKPWDKDEFSGKIQYQLDNNEKFEVYREFKKKNPKIFDDKMQDISNEFNIDKTKGAQFFTEQTGVDENLFVSSILVNQNEVKLDKGQSNIIIQKIANTFSSGEDNVSYKKAVDRISKRQLDEIGNARTREKPINITDNNIKTIEKEIKQLEDSKNIENTVSDEINKISKQINILESETNIIKEIDKIKQIKTLSEEKNKIKSEIISNNEQNLNDLNSKRVNIEENIQDNKNSKSEQEKIFKINKKKDRNEKTISIILLIVLILANICQYYLLESTVLKYVILITIPVYLAIVVIRLVKDNKKEKEKIQNIEQIQREISSLEKDKENIEEQILVIKSNINMIQEEIEKENINCDLQLDSIKREIESKNPDAKDKVLDFLDQYERKTVDEIKQVEDDLQNDINDKKVKLYNLQSDKEDIDLKINRYTKLQESLNIENQKYIELQELNNSMEIAKNTIQEAYEKMKNGVTPKLVQDLSYNISKITNNKYKKVYYNDEEGILVELENGDYINAERLSIGTIDQLYLSLRFALINELSDEKMPIILDEAFAYYDTKRLTNIFKYLHNEYSDRQIIIFTCTKREKQICDDNSITFNYVGL